MNEATFSPDVPLPPRSPLTRHARPLPPATDELLVLLQVLLVYARHLHNALRQQAERAVAFVAQRFASAPVAFVLTNLTRGILRSIALQHVLQTQAAAPADQAAGAPRKAVARPCARQPAKRGSSRNRRGCLPTLPQLEAIIRRRPIDFAIDDICRDLGMSLSLCESRFGNALRDMLATCRDDLGHVFQECLRRATAAADAPVQDASFDQPPPTRDAFCTIAGCVAAAQQYVCGFPFTASPAGAAVDGAQPP